MGIFSRKVENQVNEKPSFNDYGFYGLSLFGNCNKNVDTYLWTVLQYIFNGLKNVQYTFTNGTDKRLEDFLTKNLIYMIWLMWNYGYIVVGYDRKNGYYIPNYDKLVKDANGRIKGYECVYYSDKYRFKNKSDFQILKSTLNEMGMYKDGIMNLTNNYGAIGILSGGNLPINPQEKEDFVQNLKSRYGINSDKNNILVTTMPLKFDVMQFPVKELELDQKVKECYTLICNYFQVPVDLIFGQSTYANAEQALRNFYGNCISPLCEAVLEVGKHLIKMQPNLLIPSDKLSFRIDNVPEILESVRIVDNEYVKQTIENIKAMKELNQDTTKLEDILKAYLNSL